MIRNWLKIIDGQHEIQSESKPGLEQELADSPMHYLFEIQLITNQIVGKPTAASSSDFAWVVKKQHVRRYLSNYYRKHSSLPADRCYLGMTRPLNLEIGMIDLGAIRRKIRMVAADR